MGLLGWGRWLALPAAGLVWLLWLLAAAVTSGENPNLLRQAVPLGSENTWFQVQNIGTKVANLVVDYYFTGGFPAAQETSSTLAPGASRTFSQASNSQLPNGFGGSAVVTADAQIRTLLVKDIERNGGKAFGGENTPAKGHNKQHLPLIYSNFGEGGVWNTRFVVQNAGNTSACVSMTYRSNDGDVVFTDPAPDSPFTGCPNGGISLPPRSSLERNQADMGAELPQRYIGSVVIETVDGNTPASQQLIVATADVWRSDNRSFATYNGIGQNVSDAGDTGNVVLLPVIQKNQGPEQGWRTSYQISTTNSSQVVNVTATYCCDEEGGKLTKTFAVQSSTLVEQYLEDELPDNFNGSVTLTSDQPIAATVMRRWIDDSRESINAYTGIPLSRAGTTVWAPLLYRAPIIEGVDYNWQSWFQIQVADGGTANVQVTYYGDSLPGGSATFSHTITGVGLFDQRQDPRLPNGFVGSAVISADKPIAGVTLVHSDYFVGDSAAAYSVYGAEPLPQTTPTPTPTQNPTPTPSGEPINVGLFAEWNLVHWFPDSCKDSQSALANLIASGLLRVAWLFQPQSQSWLGFDPNVPAPINTLAQLCKEDIVWINVSDATIWAQEP